MSEKLLSQFCRCHHPSRGDTAPPLPEDQRDGHGNLVAVLCKRCTRIISCACLVCKEMPDRMWDHVNDGLCKPEPRARAKKPQPGEDWLPGVKS